MPEYGEPPHNLGRFAFELPEVMYYLYLPVKMTPGMDVRMPENLDCCRALVFAALGYAEERRYRYAYISARKGWATPDNPLNRPGWHCDGFGTDDMNFVWWTGPGTRFAIQRFEIAEDHVESLRQFEDQVIERRIQSPPEKHLYALTPHVVHATPLIGHPGCMRQYVKVSLSNQQYNLENNSHNYAFEYEWPLHSRETIRNDPHRAQQDYAP